METRRRMILFISMSLDGFIAGPDDDLSFLAPMEKPGEDYGYSAFLETIDTVIVGRRSYEKVLSLGVDYPVRDKEVFVISHKKLNAKEGVKYYSGSLLDLVTDLKAKEGKNIYCDGGSEIVYELMKNNLIDEIIVSVVPVLLGRGLPLFKIGTPERSLRLLNEQEYDTGLVKLHYIL